MDDRTSALCSRLTVNWSTTYTQSLLFSPFRIFIILQCLRSVKRLNTFWDWNSKSGNSASYDFSWSVSNHDVNVKPLNHGRPGSYAPVKTNSCIHVGFF